MKSRLIILFILIVTGCATKPTLPEDASLAIVGKAKTEILECLGPPIRTAEMDGLTFWSYKYEDTDRAATWNCELRLKIANGRVTKADIHTTVENIFGASRSLCIDAIKHCQ